MAAYAVQADLERAAGGAARLLTLADMDSSGIVDPSVITAAIDDASRWVDSYLSRRYAVPLEEPSDVIRRVTAEEAVYLLHRWNRNLGNVEGVSSDLQAQHSENIEWLTMVSEGKINPGVDPPPADSSAVAATVGNRESIVQTSTTAASVTRPKLARFV